jgi:hypothetical protein
MRVDAGLLRRDQRLLVVAPAVVEDRAPPIAPGGAVDSTLTGLKCVESRSRQMRPGSGCRLAAESMDTHIRLRWCDVVPSTWRCG